MENIGTQMRKGILEYIILSIIGKGEIYGAEIIEILNKSDLEVVEGTIYPLLSRLKNDGLIEYNRIESDSGHPRKYYSLTDKGKDTMIVMTKHWEEIQNSVKKILNNN